MIRFNFLKGHSVCILDNGWGVFDTKDQLIGCISGERWTTQSTGIRDEKEMS